MLDEEGQVPVKAITYYDRGVAILVARLVGLDANIPVSVDILGNGSGKI